jgi:hypothetical protein
VSSISVNVLPAKSDTLVPEEIPPTELGTVVSGVSSV